MVDQIINGINTAYLPSSFVQNGTIVDQQKAAEVAGGVQAKLQNMPPAEQALFLAAIQSSPDLTPDTVSKMDSGQISDAIDRLAAAADGGGGAAGSVSDAMAWLFSGGKDEIATLGRLIIEQAASEEKNALEDRLAARDIAKNDLMAQAGKLNEEADKMISGAVTALVVTCVTAAVSLFTAGMEANQTKNMGKDLKKLDTATEKLEEVNKELTALNKIEKELGKISKPAREVGESEKDFQKRTSDFEKAFKKYEQQIETKTNKFEKEINTLTKEIAGRDNKFQYHQQRGQDWSNASQANNQLGQGFSSFISTMTQAEGKKLEAEGDVDAANAQYQQSEADKAKDVQQAFQDTITKLISFLKDMMDSKANQLQAFTKV